MDAAGEVSGFTHADIGDTVGALRQTVTETLGELRQQGMVETKHKRVTVLDADRLGSVGEEADLPWYPGPAVGAI
jgi:DNA-binding FadR family transcriptional regulator